MPFGEYELSPSLIGLSLLHAAHPEAFQRLLVRTSIPCYRDFIRQLVGSLCKRHAVTAHAAPTACRRTGSGTISLFLSKCFSPFPHGTGSLSVSLEYLALPDGPGGFAQDSSCPALLRMPLCLLTLRLRGSHPLWPGFPAGPARVSSAVSRSYNPRRALPHNGFGLFPVRSPLLGESLVYFLFLRVLRCFSSPRSLHAWHGGRPSAGRVVPFGDPRIKGHLHLHAAFRSLSRPSSPE